MEIEELRTLGETAQEKSFSFDNVICRHGKTIGERRRANSIVQVPGLPREPFRLIRQCAQCIVEMEILTRLERIELSLREAVHPDNSGTN